MMVLSGSEPSDDEFSLEGDENDDEDDTLEGVDPHNPIDLYRASNSSMEVSKENAYYEKTITNSDLSQYRLYLPYNFAAYLKLSGDGSAWKITGPPFSVGKNIFFFHLLKSRGRDREWKFGVE
ncbi:hypothetical protein AHAS_Ahas02G0076300 [Arachis hypogaea]